MKKLGSIVILMMVAVVTMAAEKCVIRIGTENTDLILQVGENGRLYQVYLGERLRHETDTRNFDWWVYAATDGAVCRRGWEVCACNGNEDFFEPALSMVHSDGNRTTYLYYKWHEQTTLNGVQKTVIGLEDDRYPVSVTLHYEAYEKENVIKTWTEIRHSEKKAVVLNRFYSTMLYFGGKEYWATEFHGDHAAEVNMATQRLEYGKKIVDTKLGSRAAMHAQPFFEIGLGGPAKENCGEVLMGTIGWMGNFCYVMEVDNVGNLRVLPGINHYSSDYTLAPNTVFRTADFIFTLSQEGVGEGSRSLHDWARRYQVHDGMGDRMTLLNNWENTYFSFDQQKLADLMKEARKLGVDMFLLDDGWFGNGENARNNDRAGLGDWEVNREKLPLGIPGMIESAREAGVKFGIWIEPEMVNPKSELYENHPDWVIKLPNRDTYLYRHQLVLDMANPKVQDYVFGVVDRILTENPEVAFFKWDCNSPITNIYSPYEKTLQGNLYIDHVKGVQNVLKRVQKKYPNVPMMLCSGGGGRCDYDALQYYTEFWPSDQTNPVQRLWIQWGFSQFFPAKIMCAHVTSANRQASIKFRTDVASMCKLGFDIGLQDMSDNDIAYCQQAIRNWNDMKPMILDGDQYRLVSPYESKHMAVNYVSKDKSQAVLFAYDIYPLHGDNFGKVKIQGLDPDLFYTVEEINLMPGKKSTLKENGQSFSGDYLMKVGLDALTENVMSSRVVRLSAKGKGA